jgi:Protein of unknown function (DUF1648)
VTLAATIPAYPHLPDSVPTHWDIHGVADGYSALWRMNGSGTLRIALRPRRGFWGGFAGLALVAAGQSFWAPFTALMTGALASVVYSLYFYKQLERRGEL